MPTPSQKHELHAVTIAGIEYYIAWEQFELGGSFFLPTTVTAQIAQRALAPIVRELDVRIVCRNRTEYGRYGVRVWRIG